MKPIVALASLLVLSQANGLAVLSVPSEDMENSKYCQDCINFVGDLKQVLSSPNSTAEIENLLDQMICSQMGYMQHMCRAMVEEFVPKFMIYLAHMPDPKQLCGLLGMCREDAMKYIAQKKQFSSTEDCAQCKLAVSELKSIFNKVQIKELIAERVCPLFGGRALKCQQDVETNAALIAHFVTNVLIPSRMCETVDLCTKTEKKAMSTILDSFSNTWNPPPSNVKAMGQSKVQGVSCTLCEIAIKEVDALLANKATLSAIEAALEMMCDFLPSTMSQKCDEFVKEYVPMIIKLLSEKVSPEKICHMLHLC